MRSKPMRLARRIFLIMVVVAAVLFAGLCGALFAFQRSLIYYPQPGSNQQARTLMTLPVGKETVHVSTRPQAGPDALIYFGGNAEDVSQEIPDIAAAFPHEAIYLLTTRAMAEAPAVPPSKPSLPTHWPSLTGFM